MVKIGSSNGLNLSLYCFNTLLILLATRGLAIIASLYTSVLYGHKSMNEFLNVSIMKPFSLAELSFWKSSLLTQVSKVLIGFNIHVWRRQSFANTFIQTHQRDIC